jgi:hypothetical protein
MSHPVASLRIRPLPAQPPRVLAAKLTPQARS